MRTTDLIAALAADAKAGTMPLARVWAAALAGAAAIACVVFLMTIGPRTDIATAISSPQFLYKFVVTLALAGSALYVLDLLARPGAARPPQLLALLLAPALLAAAIGAELFLRPEEQWAMLTTGKNSLVCLLYIPVIGIGPLAVMILALRRGAPTRPVLAGVVAGIVAGAIAATFYAAHCTDDSPLFVATWYSLAIAALAVLGGIAGRLFVRW